jgi:hypothetical protein
VHLLAILINPIMFYAILNTVELTYNVKKEAEYFIAIN